MNESGWFRSIGWWDQEKAYEAFDVYRDDPSDTNFERVVELTLPIIRVVYSTKKVRVNYEGDEDDFIAAAALTITKALPKMRTKAKKTLDNDKKYMRYLFTCVNNSFFREYDVLHGKSNRLQAKLDKTGKQLSPNIGEQSFRSTEARLLLSKIPTVLYITAMELVRFDEGSTEYNICQYIIRQRITGREISKQVLRLLTCKNKKFFNDYCTYVIQRAFFMIKDKGNMLNLEDISFDIMDEDMDFDYYEDQS